MSSEWFGDVRDFMDAMGQQRYQRPVIDIALAEKPRLGMALIVEEFFEQIAATCFDGELTPALLLARSVVMDHILDSDGDNWNMVEIVDGIIDGFYVGLGMLHRMGVEPYPIWDAVHAANMLKSTGPVRADGKREKPPGFKHPDIGALIDQQRK